MDENGINIEFKSEVTGPMMASVSRNVVLSSFMDTWGLSPHTIFELYWTCSISTVVGLTVFGDNYRDGFTPNTSQTRQDNLITHKIIGHLPFLVGTVENRDKNSPIMVIFVPCLSHPVQDCWMDGSRFPLV